MTSFLDQLNLTPQERRFAVVVAVVVFIILNVLLVWPHFSDLGRVRRDLAATRAKIQEFGGAISKDAANQKELALLEQKSGGDIGGPTKSVALQTAVQADARKTGVVFDEIKSVTTANSDTNKFYEEQSVRVGFESTETNLVKFLYNAGNDPAMIRVRELNLQPADANRYRLRGYVILTANYARQTSKPAAPAAAKAAPTAIPRPGADANSISMTNSSRHHNPQTPGTPGAKKL